MLDALSGPDPRDTHRLGGPAARREIARAVQTAMGAVYFADLACAGAGPVCAIDIDGVMETEALGMPVLTPAGAGALRALHAHGHRLVVCTGRSLDQVRDRCAAYRLAGGVAEYGSAIHHAAGGEERSLVPAEARAGFARVRACLEGIDDLVIDPRYAHVVRAYRPERPGRPRREPEATLTEAALRAAAPVVLRAVPAGTQTDFVAAGIDKGTGLRALLGTTPLDFAIGDSVEDLPMLRRAAHPFAPGNADRRLGEAGTRFSPGACQLGLFQAVSDYLGHSPGSCPACRLRPLDHNESTMVEILGGLDR